MNRFQFHVYFLFILTGIFLISCSDKKHADLILKNGTICTVDSNMNFAKVMVISDGKIVALGNENILQRYTADSTIDLQGKFVYPGFIDAHSHFYGLGQSTLNVDLTGTKSWEEVITRCDEFVATNHPAVLRGRGWDQNDWEDKSYPDNQLLNEHFPDIPVLLKRVDGHAAIANVKALSLAQVVNTIKVIGGDILFKKNVPTGILIDNAVDLVQDKLPAVTRAEQIEGLLNAQKICFKYGLTTVSDAGQETDIIALIDSLQHFGELTIRVNAMVSATNANLDVWLKRGPLKTDHLKVASFKMYGDGALGSRGACLMEPYQDQANHYGFLLTTPEQMENFVKRISASSFQLNTHCIGDSANRNLLKLYGKYLVKKRDHRWRIEHAQVLHPDDFKYFGAYGIIPSVQPVHATSDMYWAGKRLGPKRIKGAYAYKELLKQIGWLPLGTDFPVESPNPWHTFYSAVERKDEQGFPTQGFQKENALTREEALKGMTIWAAKADFEEHIKGSLETGKLADFIITPIDMLHAPLKEIRENIDIITFVNGKRVTLLPKD